MRDGDGEGADWIINGSKIFISGADRADYGIVFARTDPARGRAGVTCFIVETDWPGFQRAPRPCTPFAPRTTRRSLSSRDLRVPAQNVLGEVGGGFAIANDRLSRQRIPYAAACNRGWRSRRRRWPSSTRACGRPSGRLSQPASRCRT